MHSFQNIHIVYPIVVWGTSCLVPGKVVFHCNTNKHAHCINHRGRSSSKFFDTVQHPDFQSAQCNSVTGSFFKYPMKM